MRVMVYVRRSVHQSASLRIKPDRTGVDRSLMRMGINPFDAVAVEAALTLRARKLADEIIVFGCGASAVQDVIAHGLARGGDRGVFIETPAPWIDPIEQAKLIAHMCRAEKIDIALIGRQNTDDDYGHEAPMTAALLDWPLLAQDLLSRPESIEYPCVVEIDYLYAQAETVKLPDLIKARAKPMAIWDCPFPIAVHRRTVDVRLPDPRPPAVMLGNVEDLSAMIKESIS